MPTASPDPFTPQSTAPSPDLERDLWSEQREVRLTSGVHRPTTTKPNQPTDNRTESVATSGSLPAATALPRSSEVRDLPDFNPIEPNSLPTAGLTRGDVESLCLKVLLSRSEDSGRKISEQLALPFLLIEPVLESMKQNRLITHRSAALMNDYIYQLTELGHQLAGLHSRHCSYFGTAPVSLQDYIKSVTAQSLTKQTPTRNELTSAFNDLLINRRMLQRLGPAINSGRGLFLYGAPGNGKSSIAERITAAFGYFLWIPRALVIDGHIMRLYDPNHHHEAPLENSQGLLDDRKIDKRWVRIARPTIVVGGELTMENLEATLNVTTGVSEAPVQLKSNCGTLVIDDFGRQRMRTDELLNRWIVPLEKRHDFLNLANGKKVQVPFDQLIVFSTNLEPRELVDEAFLRRVPYKIEVSDPTEEEFRDLFTMLAAKQGLKKSHEGLDYLISTHYKPTGRPFRYCHPRDLIMQIANYCRFAGCDFTMTPEHIDIAVENYFSVM